MDQRILTVLHVAKEAIRRGRERGLDVHYGLVLYPWRENENKPYVCVGVATSGGTTLPLTRGLCEALEYTPTWSDGRVLHVAVPYDQLEDEESVPLRSVGVSACLTDRQTLAAEAALEHLGAAPIVLTSRVRPPGWPR